MAKINYSLIGEALIHPIQKRILEAFRAQPRAQLTPLALSNDLSEPLGVVSYHVSLLAGDPRGRFARTPLLELTHTEPRRGAVAHFYVLTKEATR